MPANGRRDLIRRLKFKYLTVVKNRSGVGIFSGMTPCIHEKFTSSSGEKEIASYNCIIIP